MSKVTVTDDGGVATDYFPQSYTDAAVTAAVAAVPTTVTPAPEDTEIDVLLSDGSTKKFVPKV